MIRSVYILLINIVLVSVILFPNWTQAETMIHTYDDAGRLMRIDYDNGYRITYAYDANGNLTERVVLGQGPLRYTLQIGKNGTGTGTVASSPGGITCGSDCTEDFDRGSLITLSASPDNGSIFTGWDGDGCGGTDPCEVTMNADTIVTAVFDKVNHAPSAEDREITTTKGTAVDIALEAVDPDGDILTYHQVAGPSRGSVTINGQTAVYTPETDYTGGDSFTWKANDGQADSNTATVSVTIQDTETTYILNIQKTGDGDGAVTSLPEGIDCGSICREAFPEGGTVELTAEPVVGSFFEGWNGAGCTGNGVCIVTLDRDHNVTAAFGLDRDKDGISDDQENGGPNNGDGNDNGIPDSEEANVATLMDIHNGYVTLEAAEGTSFHEVKAVGNPSPQDLPDGYEFPVGFFQFRVSGIDTGGVTDINLIPHNRPRVQTYFKYGPTPDNAQSHWYEFAYENGSQTGSEIPAGTTGNSLTLHFKDGGRGDGDLEANGEITDPGGPAIPASQNAAGTGGSGGGGCIISTILQK